MDSNGFIKLCDFGSATTISYFPDDSWNALKRGQIEDEVCSCFSVIKFVTSLLLYDIFLSAHKAYDSDVQSAGNARLVSELSNQ